MINIVLKKTNELSFGEINQICSLLFEVFKREKNIDDFKRQFGKTVFNYSYHGLMVDDDKIVGNYCAIPIEYNYFGKKCVFALSVDTMISKEYRGIIPNLKKMANLVYKALIKDSIPFIYGFPNDNLYLVKKKVLKWADIGQLDYYILPINIGALKQGMRIFNIATRSMASILNQMFNIMGVSSIDRKYNIEKINDEIFKEYRYDKTYKTIMFGENAFCVYKIIMGEKDASINYMHNACIAYLIDVFPMNSEMIAKAVNWIYNDEKGNVDLIGYLGKLDSRPINLLKVPKRLEPQLFNMSGKILIDGIIDGRIFDINNWNVNLSNFDIR